MLDQAGILVSTLMILYVLFQAVRQDAKRPWFEPPEKPIPQAERAPGQDRTAPWRRPRP